MASKFKQLQIICPGDWVMITRKRLKYAEGFTKGDVAQVKTINHEKGLVKIAHPDCGDQVFLIDEISLTLPPVFSDLGCSSTAETPEICSLSPTPNLSDLGCNSTAETLETCSLNLNLDPSDLGCNSTAETLETCSLNFKQVIQWADTLSLPELNHLIDALQALQEVKENGDRAQSVNGSDGLVTPSAGYVELKRINGCGPYRYLRYRSGGRNRSVYLGKDHG